MGSEIKMWCIWLVIISCSYLTCSKKKAKTTTYSPEMIQALKNPTIRSYAYTIPMPKFPDKYRMLAGPINNQSITYFWYDFNALQHRQPSNYIMCKFNHTNSSMLLVPPPCGSIPSMNCLSEMINISLHNDTGEQACDVNTTYNPMLYNVPRWTTRIYVGKNIVILDSQSIYFLGLSEVIFRNLLRYNCSKSFYLTNAMSRNLFKFPHITLWKLKQGMRRLHRRRKPKKNNTQKRSRRSANNTTTNTPTVTTKLHNNSQENVDTSENYTLPIFVKQLQDMVTWLYTTIRYNQEPFCDKSRNRERQSAWANHTRQILYNDTVWSIHGTVNLTTLYEITPPYSNTTQINSSLFIDPLWDHIDSLAFKEEIKRNTSIERRLRPTNLSLSILPP
ncbi:Rh103 [macacine betaherpesvirus 3]|uniref:RhUL74 n=1 Tax=Rhesus cytomegalovirus (strain 68-1) TaxID=47929 RepID=Q2FAL1_RHCM6|nr:rhUL74 [macacine betaherpesvirus 3]QQL11120.1 Rh103 [macacine betaherpesvirus 3]QXV50448.1 envelope glycoprotein O [macacine betaherpesvirus 3]